MKTMKKLFAGLLVVCMMLTVPSIVAMASVTTGTWDNPTPINFFGGAETNVYATVAEGQTEYVLTYTAEADIVFTALEESYYRSYEPIERNIALFNCTVSEYDAVELSDSTETIDWLGDNEPIVKINASKGDVIKVVLTAPAGKDLNLIFLTEAQGAGAPEGTESNPIKLTAALDDDFVPILPSAETPYEVVIPAGETYYFQAEAFFAGKLMNVLCRNGNANLNAMEKDLDFNDVWGEPVALVNGIGSIETSWTGSNFDRKVVFSIENTGMMDTMYRLSFAPIPGTVEAPEVIEIGTHTHDFAAGDENYYYSFTADKDGVIKVEVSSTSQYSFLIYKGDDSYYGATHYSNDEYTPADPDEYVKVQQGDVVIILAQTYDATTWGTIDGTITTKLSWAEDESEKLVDDALEEIEAAGSITDSEDTPVIEIDAGLAIPSEVIDAAKEHEVGIVIGNLETDAYLWSIKPEDITVAGDLNLTISNTAVAITETLINGVLGEIEAAAAIPVVLPDNDNFGLKATLSYLVGADHATKYANLFYYNPETQALVHQGAKLIGEEGVVDFDFTHASEYVILVGEDLTPVVDETGDFSNTAIYTIILLGAACVLAGFAAKKRFA